MLPSSHPDRAPTTIEPPTTKHSSTCLLPTFNPQLDSLERPIHPDSHSQQHNNQLTWYPKQWCILPGGIFLVPVCCCCYFCCYTVYGPIYIVFCTTSTTYAISKSLHVFLQHDSHICEHGGKKSLPEVELLLAVRTKSAFFPVPVVVTDEVHIFFPCSTSVATYN